MSATAPVREVTPVRGEPMQCPECHAVLIAGQPHKPGCTYRNQEASVTAPVRFVCPHCNTGYRSATTFQPVAGRCERELRVRWSNALTGRCGGNICGTCRKCQRCMPAGDSRE